MSTSHTNFNKRKPDNSLYRKKIHQNKSSFDAINKAFGKTPKWRQREIGAKKRRQEKREELIQSVKMLGDDDEFDEDVFSSLFDDKDNHKSIEHNDANKYTKHKRKRLSKKKRKLLYETLQQTPTKRRKLNEEEEQYTDKDFTDKGIIIQTVHSKNNSNTKTNTNSSTTNVTKTKIATIESQIHRFELTQLMIDNIPRDHDESTLNKHMIKHCSIEVVDIHLFHNKMDDTKCGKAMITFVSSNDCALAYKCLLDHELAPNHTLSVKTVSHKYSLPKDEDSASATNKRCKVLKLRNLHWKTSEEDIINWFDECIAAPLKVHIHVTSNGYPTGEAKVEFKSTQHIDEALLILNGEKLLERDIVLSKAISKQVFGFDGKEFMNKTLQIAVFNISGGVQEDDLKQFIVEQCGDDCVANDIHLIHHLELFTTGYAFCKFSTHEITNKVVQSLNNKELQARALRVIWSKPSKEYRLRQELAGKTKVILCTNLRYDVTASDIRGFVQTKFDYRINNVKISENAKGFRYGMAKVWFRSCKQARDVVDALNGTMLKERVVHMNYWENREGKRGRGKSQKNKGNKVNKVNKQKQVNNEIKKNKVKIHNNWEWNDKFFEDIADKSGDTANINKEKKNVKVPQRLLDQIL